MNPQNTSGNFGTAIDGGSALGRALARRRNGEPTSALSQVSGGTPFGQESSLPPEPPETSAMPQGVAQEGQPAPAPQGAEGATMPSGTPVGNPEAQLIIKALTSRLSTISKVEQGGV